MPKPEPEPGEMIPDEPPTGKKGKRKKKKKGLKAVSTNNRITYVDKIGMIFIVSNCIHLQIFCINQGMKNNPEGKTKLLKKPKLKRLGTFPCDRCGKMFKRTDHLLRHIRETHNNIKKVSIIF